jgi:hypothetical protein
MTSLVQANVTFQGSITSLGTLGQTTFAPVDLGVNSLSLKTGNLTSLITTTSSAPTGFAAAGEGALVFPGTANAYISFGTGGQPFSNSNIFAFGDFVVEAWVNPSTWSNNPVIFASCDTNIGGLWFFYIGSSGSLSFYTNMNGVAAAYGTTATVPINTWSHVAMIHQGSTKRFQMYINGQPQSGTVGGTGFTTTGTIVSYTTGIIPTTSQQLVIGQQSTSYFTGYMTNLRVTTGSGAMYLYNNTAFTPSTSPLFPASNVTGGSLTTRLLVRVPLAPNKMVVPKLGGANCNTVLAFPPAPMTSYATNMTGQSYYGQGTYVASASSELGSSYQAWQAFDKVGTTVGSIWASYAAYGSTSPYGTLGSNVTVDVTGTSYAGEWLQLQMPSSIILANYSLTGGSQAATQSPARFWILGSRDGTSWSLVDSRTGVGSWVNYVAQNFSVSSGQAFTYFRIVVNQLAGYFSANPQCVIAEWTLNGTIEGPGVSADGRLGLGVSNPVQALEVAGSAVVAGTLSAGNPLMFRNRIINGDMRIAQRGTTRTTSTGSSGPYVLDRFYTSYFITTGGLTHNQNTLSVSDAPYQQGLRYAMNVVATTACTNYAYIVPSQPLEGYSVQDFNWGTAYGSPVSASFWFKTNAPIGSIFALTLRNYNSGPGTSYYCYNDRFATSAVNTWQYFTFQIPPPPSTSTWFAGSAGSLELDIGAYTNGLASGTGWVNGNSIGLSDGTNWPATLNNYVAFTGVQLEKGSVATPFEVRPYGVELALCQRYYEKSYDQGVNPGTATAAGVFTGVAGNPSGLQGPIFKVPKRVAPIGSGIAYYSKAGTSSVLTNWSNDLDGSAITGGGDYSQYGIRYILASVTTGSLYYYHWTVSTEL